MSIGGDYGAFRKDGVIYSHPIEGYFIIRLRMIYNTKEKLEFLKNEYGPWHKDELETYEKKPKRYEVFSTLKEFAEKTEADVHFLFDEDMAYIVEKNGDLKKIDYEYFMSQNLKKSN